MKRVTTHIRVNGEDIGQRDINFEAGHELLGVEVELKPFARRRFADSTDSRIRDSR